MLSDNEQLAFQNLPSTLPKLAQVYSIFSITSLNSASPLQNIAIPLRSRYVVSQPTRIRRDSARKSNGLGIVGVQSEQTKLGSEYARGV
jgi:hypothetical protein